jgi:hypothetical protein
MKVVIALAVLYLGFLFFATYVDHDRSAQCKAKSGLYVTGHCYEKPSEIPLQ